MALDEYKRKRNFEKTPEPKGKKSARKKKTFVVQKHDASHLHYDVRLEIEGTLKSWAVPKGPSLNPDEKRLAVETEDHPLAYATFEGVIPPGNYGAGTVMIWDYGTYENISEKDDKRISATQAYEKGHITFTLRGKKLRGEFTLIKTKRPKQWLLVKKR